MPEVFIEPRVPVNQVAISATAFTRDDIHHRVPLGHVVAAVLRHGRGQCHRAGGLLQGAQSDAPQAVLFVDNLALLGDAEAAVDRAGRGAENGRMRLAAAAADRAATSVEQGKFDVLF